MFMLSPVYFASSAHTAFADMRSAVGWRISFFSVFAGNVHGLEPDTGKDWVCRPQFRGRGWEGPHHHHHLTCLLQPPVLESWPAHLSPGVQCPQPGSPPSTPAPDPSADHMLALPLDQTRPVTQGLASAPDAAPPSLSSSQSDSSIPPAASGPEALSSQQPSPYPTHP